MIQKTLFAGIVVGHQPQPGASQLFEAGELAGDQGQEENCERRLDWEKYSGLSFKWKKISWKKNKYWSDIQMHNEGSYLKCHGECGSLQVSLSSTHEHCIPEKVENGTPVM